MDHAVDVVVGEDLFEGGAVADVHLVKAQALEGFVAHDLAHAVEHLGVGVGQIVHHDYLVAVLKQVDAGMAADKTGATGDEDASVLGLLGFHEGPFFMRPSRRHLYAVPPGIAGKQNIVQTGRLMRVAPRSAGENRRGCPS